MCVLSFLDGTSHPDELVERSGVMFLAGPLAE